MFNSSPEQKSFYAHLRLARGPRYKIALDGTRRLCIPSNCRLEKTDGTITELREKLLYSAHTTLGHMSGKKTYNYMMDYFFWPKMRKDTYNYCQQCDTCQNTRYTTQLPQGLARILPIPQKTFTHLSMDFLALPPKSRKERNMDVINDSIWVIWTDSLPLRN